MHCWHRFLAWTPGSFSGTWWAWPGNPALLFHWLFDQGQVMEPFPSFLFSLRYGDHTCPSGREAVRQKRITYFMYLALITNHYFIFQNVFSLACLLLSVLKPNSMNSFFPPTNILFDDPHVHFWATCSWVSPKLLGCSQHWVPRTLPGLTRVIPTLPCSVCF